MAETEMGASGGEAAGDGGIEPAAVGEGGGAGRESYAMGARLPETFNGTGSWTAWCSTSKM